METAIMEAELRVNAAREAKLNEIENFKKSKTQLATLTKLNREKLEQEHGIKMQELMSRLEEREKVLDDLKKEKYSQDRRSGSNTDRIMRVKKEREKKTKDKKNNMLINLHKKEQILKAREKEKEIMVQTLRAVNESKTKRKDLHHENHRKKMEKRRKEFLQKLHSEQEKAEEYAKQKEMILEHKYTNQMIDQMKMHYYQELHFNMKIQNKVGSEEFDKLAQNLKSIPKED